MAHVYQPPDPPDNPTILVRALHDTDALRTSFAPSRHAFTAGQQPRSRAHGAGAKVWKIVSNT
jgi:hypothetical protein